LPSVVRLVPPVSARVPAVAGRVALAAGRVDSALGGGLALAGCHEIYGPAATPLALMLALASARAGPILWLADRQGDDGRLYGAGLAELGGDPGRLWLVQAGGAVPMLRAAAEAQRCAALACLVIEAGSASAVDLTVTRRLQLAAAASGVFTLLLRAGPPRPSAALTRWRAAHAPSRRLAGNAPGPPRLVLSLERQRGGPADMTQELEWDRDRRRFLPATTVIERAIPIGAAFGRRPPCLKPPHLGRVPAVVANRTPRPAAIRAA
jgi:protein ImuA